MISDDYLRHQVHLIQLHLAEVVQIFEMIDLRIVPIQNEFIFVQSNR